MLRMADVALILGLLAGSVGVGVSQTSQRSNLWSRYWQVWHENHGRRLEDAPPAVRDMMAVSAVRSLTDDVLPGMSGGSSGLKRKTIAEVYLHGLVWLGCVQSAGLLIDETGADVNLYHHGYLLEVAALRDNMEMVRFLLDRGANVKLSNGPLTRAFEQGHYEIAKLLLSLNADRPSLRRVTKAGNVEAVRLLLEAGTSPDGWSGSFSRPLHTAAELGQTEIGRMLLESQADPNVSDHEKRTPLHIATAGGHTQMVRLLLEHGADANATDEGGRTPLHVAAVGGDAEMVRLLLEHGADLAADGPVAQDALYLGALDGDVDLVCALIEKGVDIGHARAGDGRTPLHIAAAVGEPEVVKLLLEHGAAPATKDTAGKTAMDLAAAAAHADTVAVLQPHFQDSDLAAWVGDARLLISASASGGEELVRKLLQAGTSVDAADSFGKQAIHRAAGEGHIEVVRILLEHGADVDARVKKVTEYTDDDTPLLIALGENELAVARLLIDRGADVNAAAGGWTPLMRAAMSLRTQPDEGLALAKLLVEKGADVNAADEGHTALHCAAYVDSLELVSFLLEHGANPDVVNEYGKRPSDMTEREGILELLREQGTAR